jgi:hypothetical protein
MVSEYLLVIRNINAARRSLLRAGAGGQCRKTTFLRLCKLFFTFCRRPSIPAFKWITGNSPAGNRPA